MYYHQIIDEILLFAKQQFDKDNNGEYVVYTNNLFRHFDKMFLNTNLQDIFKMIDEIDVSGWLLSRDYLTLVFDPATFQ